MSARIVEQDILLTRRQGQIVFRLVNPRLVLHVQVSILRIVQRVPLGILSIGHNIIRYVLRTHVQYQTVVYVRKMELHV